MWKLGKYTIKGKVVLAPMAGITSAGYRRYLNCFGVDIAVTEMVSDMGLIYENKETETYVKYQKDETLTGVQLFGSKPENLSKAVLKALALNPEIDFFDINMGCPAPKVTKTGAGSALMVDPVICGDIIRAIKQVTDKPVTAKIRLGYNEINFIEVIKQLESAGVDAIAIHARTRKELYSGEPHYDLLKDLRKKMSVPLIVSGNIYTVEDAIRALENSGAEAVMVARGGMGNPFLITQIKTYFETGERLPDPSLLEQCDYCLALARSMILEKGELTAMRIYRTLAPKFFSGFAHSKTLRKMLATSLTTYDSLEKMIAQFKKDNLNT
ncbi:MAG: tRNA-dihydrouridine synthase family protein [Erysipelotrichia bacterium]|nr:tRNA-dihydrouridine synthase family protein [Erysipelotrichia bacterium]